MKNIKTFESLNEGKDLGEAKTPEIKAKALEWMAKQKTYDKANDSLYGFISGYEQALKDVRTLLKDNKAAQYALINANLAIDKVK